MQVRSNIDDEVHSFLRVHVDMAVHNPPAGIRRSEPDHGVSARWHDQGVLDRRVSGVERRTTGSLGRAGAERVAAARDVSIERCPVAGLRIVVGEALGEDGKVVAVDVDRVVFWVNPLCCYQYYQLLSEPKSPPRLYSVCTVMAQCTLNFKLLRRNIGWKKKLMA